MAKGDRKLGRARSQSSLKRKAPTRKINKKILIVCQGADTEHHYFNEFRNERRLISTSIEIPTDAHGFSAGGLLKFAEKRIKRESKRGDGFDKVFIVFDRDDDQSFTDTVNKTSAHKVIDSAYSIPCFEYWLLLHFDKFRAPFEFKDGSWSKELCAELEKRIGTNYKKSGKHAYQATKDLIPDAIENSKWSLRDVEATGEDNPSTMVHELVEYLLEQK